MLTNEDNEDSPGSDYVGTKNITYVTCIQMKKSAPSFAGINHRGRKNFYKLSSKLSDVSSRWHAAVCLLNREGISIRRTSPRLDAAPSRVRSRTPRRPRAARAARAAPAAARCGGQGMQCVYVQVIYPPNETNLLCRIVNLRKQKFVTI